MKVLGFFFFLLVFFSSSVCFAKENKQKKVSSPAVCFQAPLGKSFGKPLSLEVVILKKQRRKGGFRYLHVLAVDGKKLKKKLRMRFTVWYSSPKLRLVEGKNIHVRGFQHGQFMGTPHSVMKETNLFLQTMNYHWDVSLVLYKKISP